MLTNVPGFTVGHWTDRAAATGCTVILCPPKTKASCEVRGNSPGSRELALLAPEKSMQEVHAVLLTGGSALGLASADGVMRWMLGRGIGYETPWARIPIVPAAVVFDLNVGSSKHWPDADSGYSACENASSGPVEEGCVGAGTGTTVGKWNGIETAMKGGVGTSSVRTGDLVVGALVIANAVGDVLSRDGTVLAGARDAAGKFLAHEGRVRTFARAKVLDQANTTLAVVATNAALDKLQLFKVAQRMHDGFARSIAPVHTSYDGDVSFALSSGELKADFEVVAELAAEMTAESIRRAVQTATTLAGIPGLAGRP
jgi:L-aminopeptidase/D-esterase-like protein